MCAAGCRGDWPIAPDAYPIRPRPITVSALTVSRGDFTALGTAQRLSVVILARITAKFTRLSPDSGGSFEWLHGATAHRIRCHSMVVLRCTQKLLARLKHAGDAPPVESTTRLGDWYGNILRLGHRQLLIFISERSRLPVVIPIQEAKRLDSVFPDAVCRALARAGVGADDVARERSHMSAIAFGPTRNRSLLGTLNDFAQMAKFTDARRDEPESPEELMRFLAQTPILPLKGARPVDLTLAAFRQP
jgi:hypothetical protein